MPFVLIDRDYRPLRSFASPDEADAASRSLPGSVVAVVPGLLDGSPDLEHLHVLAQHAALWQEVGKL